MERDEVIDRLTIDLDKIESIISKASYDFGVKYSDIVFEIILDGLNSGLSFEQILSAMNYQFRHDALRICIAIQAKRNKTENNQTNFQSEE